MQKLLRYLKEGKFEKEETYYLFYLFNQQQRADTKSACHRIPFQVEWHGVITIISACHLGGSSSNPAGGQPLFFFSGERL